MDLFTLLMESDIGGRICAAIRLGIKVLVERDLQAGEYGGPLGDVRRAATEIAWSHDVVQVLEQVQNIGNEAKAKLKLLSTGLAYLRRETRDIEVAGADVFSSPPLLNITEIAELVGDGATYSAVARIYELLAAACDGT